MLGETLADPNLAFLLLVLGALGLLWEAHAPGLLAPGVLGALFIGAGAYGMYRDAPDWYGLTLMMIAALLLLIELKYYTHMISGLAGTILLAFSATVILTGPKRVNPSVAIAVSLAFGILTIFLGLLGMRARRSRPVMGVQSLVGEMGVARTEIPAEGTRLAGIERSGTVLVHGEYWQARSRAAISPGQRVCVERVEDLVVYVREA